MDSISPETRRDATPEIAVIARSLDFKHHELLIDELRILQEQVQEIARDPERFIDRGGVGAVYSITEHLCIKVLEPRHESPNAHLMNLGQPVHVEAGIQRMLGGVEIDGVRAPYVYAYARAAGENTRSIIVMERLDAVNLQHVLNETAQCPKRFDAEHFLASLEEYLDHIHERFGIVHGDLEPRNIMIDIKTGMPRLIDFGRSRVVSSLSREQRQRLIDADNDQFAKIAEILSI